jgi:ferritin-like metal-binding protein YciE
VRLSTTIREVSGSEEADGALDYQADGTERDGLVEARTYEIATYGTAAALAGQLDLRDEQRVLHESMEEEREMDARLTQLAKSEVNQDALAA